MTSQPYAVKIKLQEFDINGLCIRKLYHNGFEQKWDYDDNGNAIYYWDSSDNKEWTERDIHGNIIYRKIENKTLHINKELWFEYDEQHRQTKYYDNEGFVEDYTYNDITKKILIQNSDGEEYIEPMGQ